MLFCFYHWCPADKGQGRLRQLSLVAPRVALQCLSSPVGGLETSTGSADLLLYRNSAGRANPGVACVCACHTLASPPFCSSLCAQKCKPRIRVPWRLLQTKSISGIPAAGASWLGPQLWLERQPCKKKKITLFFSPPPLQLILQ